MSDYGPRSGPWAQRPCTKTESVLVACVLWRPTGQSEREGAWQCFAMFRAQQGSQWVTVSACRPRHMPRHAAELEKLLGAAAQDAAHFWGKRYACCSACAAYSDAQTQLQTSVLIEFMVAPAKDGCVRSVTRFCMQARRQCLGPLAWAIGHLRMPRGSQRLGSCSEKASTYLRPLLMVTSGHVCHGGLTASCLTSASELVTQLVQKGNQELLHIGSVPSPHFARRWWTYK